MPNPRPRRTFLKSLAAAAGGVPFFRMLRNSAGAAPASAAPLRLLGIFSPLGTSYPYWRPRTVGSSVPGSGPTTGFDLTFPNAILGPLAKHQDKLIVLDGLDLVPEVKLSDSGHAGSPCTLTGDAFSNSNGDKPSGNPSAPSLDQFLGAQPMIGGQTKFRTVELGVGGAKYDTRVMSWAAGGKKLPRMYNPYQAFQYLFSGTLPAGAAPPPVDPSRLAKHALDYAQADGMRLRRRLGTLEGQKLDQHLAALSDLSKRLSGGAAGGAGAATCSQPAAPGSTWVSLAKSDPNPNAEFDAAYAAHIQEASDLQSVMIAQAFACDLTRVITMQYFMDGCDGPAPWALPGIPSADEVGGNEPHKTTHLWWPDSDPREQARQLRMAVYQRWYAQQISKLMDELAAIPEGDGTLLDHTLILWVNENGDAHDYHSVPMVLAGGANGVFRTGRYLKLAGVPHNRLLVSVANAFPGVSITSYGNSPAHDWGSGGLAELTA
jgi:hypothetical protein